MEPTLLDASTVADQGSSAWKALRRLLSPLVPRASPVPQAVRTKVVEPRDVVRRLVADSSFGAAARNAGR